MKGDMGRHFSGAGFANDSILAKLVVTVIVLISFTIWIAAERRQSHERSIARPIFRQAVSSSHQSSGFEALTSSNRFGTTVILHRGVELDLSSSMDRTIPVTGNPSKITVAASPRNWAKRQRLATFGSVI
jgi:hypothetical protein